MGIVQTDRLKAAPVQALRAVFSGVGQLFLTADKIKTQAQERTADATHAVAARQAAGRRQRSQPRRTGLSRAAAVTAAQARADSRWRSLDKTGNVRLLTADELAGELPDDAGNGRTASQPQAEPAARQPAAGHAGTGPALGHQQAGQQAPGQSGEPGGLPIANYDMLSLPSLRARLRSLDVDQLAQLTDYERAHAARAGVLSMFENRLAKLHAGG
jgi:hypothetical protein